MMRRMNSNRATSTPGLEWGQRRRGLLSLEVILILPMFLILILALVEFSFIFMARSNIQEACYAGVRLATLTGVTPEEVEYEVLRSLGDELGTVINVQAILGQYSGDEVVVSVRAPMQAAAPNLLWPIGYNLEGRHFVAEARMLKE